MAVVSTGEEVWHLSVTGIIMNRTWVNIGITWNKPNLEDSNLPVDKLGGLEMYINQEKVGSTLLPEFTDDSKQENDFTELCLIGLCILSERTTREGPSFLNKLFFDQL